MAKRVSSMAQYPIIDDDWLPEDVMDEICENCPGNGSGTLINGEYWPKFSEWLMTNGYPQVVIVWWNW